MTAGETWKRIEAVILVTVVSMLVWLYAEGETLQDGEVTLRVQFVSLAEDVQITPRERPNITVKYAAPNRSVAEFESLAQQMVNIEVSYNQASINQELLLKEELEKHPAIKDLNVTIMETDPARLPIVVERINVYSAPVVIDRGGLELAGEPTANPPTVEVHMTQTVRSGIEGELTVVARLGEVADLADAPRNVALTRDIPVRLAGTAGNGLVAFKPPRVTVSLTILKQTATAMKEGVPIYVRMPVIASNQYEVVTENEQRLLAEPVELTGPREIIEQIEKNEVPIFAELRLTTDDLEKAITSKAVHITAPTGVVVTSAIPTIKFTIRKRPEVE